MSEKVRVRIAPSPTGYIHIGTIRTALHAWLFARQNDGVFILRIEDTDKKREVEGGVKIIKDTLEAVKLNWDEYYLQSERKNIHKKWAEKLYKKGLAYADNVTPEEVDAWRADAQKKKKPFLYRDYITDERIVPWVYGKNALKLKSTPKAYKWHDEVRGNLSAGPEAIDDLTLIKSDGYATYNFCHIVDDYEMKISHIFRTDEFLSSTPKFLNIYEALEIGHPKFVTLAPIMAEGGKKKLGKRDGAKDALDYLKDGVLVEAFLNFLALLGWNPGKDNKQEIFTLDELIKEFSIEGLGKSGANYDQKRLEWINGHHIRNLPLNDLYKLSEKFWGSKASQPDREYKKEVLALIQERLKYLSEIPELTTFFFEEPKVTKELLLSIKGIEQPQAIEFLNATLESFCDSRFTVEDLQERLNRLLEDLNTKPGILFALIRNAVSGSKVTPGLAEMVSVLGKKVTIERLESALLILKH
ncbi:MAG: nondiscriminating glutamyl-tRNA synthetase [Patescibacteria group bacterium]|nr:nondiscriminating glutamyl-tRNA synthetase [Patescibacteria group bacterium]